MRLDKALAERLADLSRARLQALIAEGRLSRDGVVMTDGAARAAPGYYLLDIPPPAPAEPAAEAIALSVLYEDAHLIVIDKPRGMVAHPAAGHASGTLVNALLAHCGPSLSGIGGVRRPGIVHRLDKDTTGLLLVAKSDAAHRALAEQFAAHGADGRLERGYRALAWGVPDRPRGSIDAPLGRSSANRTRMAVVAGDRGRRAVTHYSVLEAFPAARGDAGRPVASLLRLTLETGRTHQVRVHLAHIGHPLLGDMTYGSGHKASARKLGPAAAAALAALGRQALHAAELKFEHPVTGKRLAFESALPADMAALVAALRAGPGQRPG
ncbi:MAG: RluA family pseudouridine synthase [Hyphomicrobiaceae bacterium]|nr:RluA family pseudouridine synthase [Hyphomicrobiaceae bacterium]